MEFNHIVPMDAAIQKEGIPIYGMAYNSKEEPHIRIDFRDEATDAQKKRAWAIVEDVLANVETYKAAYEEEESKKVTPEKVQPLVDLLVAKGILTVDELQTL